MTFLPDINVWIALAVIEHPHHARALRWFDSTAGVQSAGFHSGKDRLAFCRITQMGFLRLLTNQHVMQGDQLTPDAAWQRLDHIYREIDPLFATEPKQIEKPWRTATSISTGGPNMWTDAYLTAFARAAGFTFVTFDRGASSPGKGTILL